MLKQLSRFALPGSRGASLAVNLLVCLGYYALAAVSRDLASAANEVSAVWAPDGWAVAWIWLGGKKVLPGVLAGAFLGNFWAFFHADSWLVAAISLTGIVAMALGNTAGGVLGTAALRRTLGLVYPFDRVSATLYFLLYVGLLGPVVNATVGAAALALIREISWGQYGQAWLVWWIASVAGILTLTPPLLTWRRAIHRLLHPQPGRLRRPPTLNGRSRLKLAVRALETACLVFALILIGAASFWNRYNLAYLMFPLMVWAAFRFGLTGSTTVMFLAATVALLGTVRGVGIFTGADLNDALISLQVFIVVLVPTALVMSAVLSERRVAEAQLKLTLCELQVTNTALEEHGRELARNNEQLQAALVEVETTHAQMIQSEKMSALGNLLAEVAHEINNPLSFLEGNLSPALDYIHDLLGLVGLYQHHYPQPAVEIEQKITDIDLEFLSEDLPKLIGSLSQGVNRIKTVSSSLRNFSRADRDCPVVFDLTEAIEGTLLMLKHRLKETAGRPMIQVNKHYDNLPPIEGYAGQINQVLMNLLANAIDAIDQACPAQSPGQPPPQITLTGERSPDGQSVRLSLRDTGIGMSEEVKAKIFNHLYTTKEVGRGTGLGLSIAQQIVTEKHHGSLEVNSVLGEGTEFVMTLPIKMTPESKG